MATVNKCAATWAALVLFAAGCGDPLLGESFRGTPRWSFRADLLLADRDQEPPKTLRAAFFFAPDIHGLDPDGWRELVASSMPIGAPSYNTINVFEPPGPDLLVAGTSYGVARLAAYNDLNGDGRRQPGEPVVAAQGTVGYVYNAAPLDAAHSPTGNPLEAGFRHVFLPQSCGDAAPGPTTPGNCGVTLGSACLTQQDCGTGGTCISQLALPWPGGYCAIPDPPVRACRPAAGVYFRKPSAGFGMPSITGYWLRRCATDDDCQRTGEPNTIRYFCDPGLRACVPSDTPTMILGPLFRIQAFCARDV